MNSLDMIETTLTNYYELCNRPEIINADKKHQPLLVLRTINGVKKVEIIEDRSQLSFLKRFLAYLGYGEASLKQVTNFLQEYKGKFSKANTVAQSLGMIDSKITHRNIQSWIQTIPTLLPVNILAIKDFANASSTTYHPLFSNLDEDILGIIDFSHVFSEGVGYIADGSGHGKPDKRKKLQPLWETFKQKFISQYRQNITKWDSERDVEAFLKSIILDLSAKFEEQGIASTFSLSALIEMSNKKYVASIHVGDSKLIHVTKNGKINSITPPQEDSANQLELSSLSKNSPIYFDIREVQSGDKIYGMTDGITDFLPSKNLNKILSNKKISGSNLLPTIEKEIENLNFDDQEYTNLGIKKLDCTNKDCSDDISAFVMVVP